MAWLWKLVDGVDDVVRPDHPADPPPGHGVGLGDTVDDDALIGEIGHERRHRGELVRTVGEVLVDLVGDHPDAVLQRPLPDRLDGLGRVHGTGRVVGADEQQHLGPLGPRRVELLDGDLEAALGVGVDDDGHAAGERDRLGVGGPVGRRHDHLVARVAERGEGGVDGMLAAVGHQHLAGGALVPRVALGLDRDRLLQLGEAAGGRVAVVLGVATGGDRRVDDVFRGGEVGLAGPEPDHVLAGCLQRLGLGVDRQGGRRGNGSETSGGAIHGRPACHRLAMLPTPV